MDNVIYIIPVIVVIIISVVIVKIASVALKMTGLNERKARFQALSAFTGTGFTTKDSETILENEIRERIVMGLMILGNAGLVTVITTLVFSFGKGGVRPALANTAMLLVAVFVLYKLATHKRLTVYLTKRIESKLERRPPFHKRPVEEVLRVAKDYGIAEVTIKNPCQNLGKSLADSSFRDNNILVLAIERKNGVIPTPHADDIIREGDTIICYGKLDNIVKMV